MALVHIVGAGPAGCVAAMSALESGHEAIISEEHGEAGWPSTCSGLFSREGLQSLARFIDHRKTVINSIRGADIHFSTEVFRVRAKETVAYVCDRPEFDAMLAENAEAAGARMRYGERVRTEFRSDFIIGADGPNSHVARHFNFPAISRYVCAMKALVPYDSSAGGGQSIIKMYISSERFPGFFGWMIPHSKDMAEFGAGVSLPGNVRKAWDHLMGMHGIAGPQDVSSDIIPMEARRRTSIETGRRKILLVGDAAGQVKATTGGGVIFGGNCARLAGRHFNNPLRYELAWRTRFGPDLFLHRAIRDHLDTSDEKGLATLGRRMNGMRMDDYLSEHGSMDSPAKMVTPAMLIHLAGAIAGLK
jgi:digeranylgeranylglycerophospholipid reductase